MKDASCGFGSNMHYHFGDSSNEVKDGAIGIPEQMQGRARVDKTTCPVCHSGSLYEMNWCQSDNIPCEEDCPSFRKGLDCPVMGKKLRCDYCESVTEDE